MDSNTCSDREPVGQDSFRLCMKRIDVTKALIPNREKFHSYVDRIFDSGWLTNRGELVQELETRLAEYLGVRNVVLAANGTLALQVAYKALGIQGEVITTPFTFIATASSLAWEGLDVVFSDIDAGSFNIDVEDIKKKITPRTSAVVPVHVFGNPCDVNAIEHLAKTENLKVIYDASHAFGVRYQGESVLNWGDVSTLSFHATKLFHTIEGGALIIQDDSLAEKARKMINFGIVGPESIECLGINAKMNEFQAAMGLCLLDDLESVIRRRAELTTLYDSVLGDCVVHQQWIADATCNHSYYPVLFKDEETTKRIQNALNAENIFPRRYFYPSLDTLPFLNEGRACRISRDVASRILCLPLYPELGDDYRKISEIILSELLK